MWRILACALIAFGLLGVQPALGASTFMVTNTNEYGVGSLYWAIENANGNPGQDLITFNIPYNSANCAGWECTIYPIAYALPPLTDNAGVIIDGYTQPNAVYATSIAPAALKIVVDGSNWIPDSMLNGLEINSSNNTVRGLVIGHFSGYGVKIAKSGETGAPYTNTISGNHIGVNVGGTIAAPNSQGGVLLASGAQGNTIGGDAPAERNVISGNTNSAGVVLDGALVSANQVSGNYIGLTADGSAALGNKHGVNLLSGAHDNLVGGTDFPQRNIISGNTSANVHIAEVGSNGNLVLRNFIGSNAAGSAAVGGPYGVLLERSASQNLIGVNLISGNATHGVLIRNTTTQNNQVQANWIGLNSVGNAALPNAQDGVHIEGATLNLIGGDSEMERNIISGNGQNGVGLGGMAATNTVSGNFIGTDPAGAARVPNLANGVLISGAAQHNLVGGDTAGERNQISANGSSGVAITDLGTDENTVSGNWIGMISDDIDLRNWMGVQIAAGAQRNVIGGNTPALRNVIAGNFYGNVVLMGGDTAENVVVGNYIGTDASGTHSYNVGDEEGGGVTVTGGASHNVIGRCNGGEGNLISGNPNSGIYIDNGANYNTVSCNWIGLDANLAALGNWGNGVAVGPNAGMNKLEGNAIAYNLFNGVLVNGADSDINRITVNSIFSNNTYGIELMDHGNNDMLPPAISGVTLAPDGVSGTACANCVVEVFANRSPDGEGELYLGTATATVGGVFNLTGITIPAARPFLTATAYRAADGTSEFCIPVLAPYRYLYLPLVSR